MGCDIHATIEVKHEDKWICVDTLRGHHMCFPPESDPIAYSHPIALRRSYKRFAALAGVRGEGPAPLGVPDDVSETTKFLIDSWGADGHSHSYMSIRDAAQLWLRTEHRELDSSWAKENPASYFFNCETDDDTRIVFWFDN